MKHIQIAVSEFALPSPRTGSIDTYSGYGPLPSVGQEIHFEIQTQRQRENPGYQAERWISQSFEAPGFKITVGGRMDGFLFSFPAQIEEIKSAYNIEALLSILREQSDHPYLRQLRTYGYMHYLQSGGTEPELRLILACARTRKTEIVPVILDTHEYSQWLQRRLDEIATEQKAFEKLHARRKAEAQKLVFPFTQPRAGQLELMQTVEKNLLSEDSLMLQAPTGVGKTIGVLFPSLREAYSRGNKLIYVTAKNSQHEVAEEAVKKLQQAGCKVRAVTLHAKTKMCFKEEPHCNPQVCEFAKDHYDKIAKNNLTDVLAKKKNLSATGIQKLARKFEVCPFDLQLEAVARADVVICDYNYVFSPYNARPRLAQNGFGSKSTPNLVVDEAHNLPARANEYFSARLNENDLREHFAQAVDLAPETRAAIEDVRSALFTVISKYARGTPARIEIDPKDFEELQTRTGQMLSLYLSQGHTLKLNDPVLKLGNALTDFINRANEMDDNFIATWTPGHRGGSLKILCCDPSRWLRESYSDFANVVAFSATLKPFDYYARLLGFASDNLEVAEFQSPFPRERRKVLIIPQISTKVRDRSQNYNRIAETIQRLVRVRPGNYFAFFPSFDFMNEVAGRVDTPEFDHILQTREMSRSAIETVLGRLRTGKAPTLVFAVQGGVFAEGVDYPGDMLIGAFIVGPALPQFDFEREQLRAFYERKYGQGFDYTYTYPAMARVVQSAGRVIRSQTDRGLIVLMDRRFLEDSYVKAMPQDWCPSGPSNLVSERILSDVKKFWDESNHHEIC